MKRKAIQISNPSAWDRFTEPKIKAEPEFIAFCLWCGTWLTEKEVEIMKHTKRCPDPDCKWMLFRYNYPGTRVNWEQERAKQPKYGG